MQNKFNTRQLIQNLMGHFLHPNQNTFTQVVSRVVSFVVISYVCVVSCFAFIYIDKRSRDTNLLIYSRLSSKSLEKGLCLNEPEHSTTFKIAKLGQKHIMSLLQGKKRKKIHTSRNRKRIGRYIT